MKTAVVFSAGGLFGAWEVGVWRELEGIVKPDIVVGASIGALNGWMVSSGCSAVELERRWLDLHVMSRLEWRIPRRPLDGVFVAMAAIGEGRADPAAFVSGSRAGRLASPGQKDSWHARGMQ